MRVWLRVGRGWGVSLGFWGTLLYLVGWLMFAMLVAALAIAALALMAALAVLAAIVILGSSAWTSIREARWLLARRAQPFRGAPRSGFAA